MRHAVQRRVIDRANALGSRVLCALFAIMALCATPLGTGELLAAETYVYERERGELHDGDLPLRFAMQGGGAQVIETIEELHVTGLSAALHDDGPDGLSQTYAIAAGETGTVDAGPPSPGVRRTLQTSFEARAPPRA